jgi:microcystin-dependent protein
MTHGWGFKMSEPFLGELKIISWNFAPQGWAFCNGQFLPINQNQALFSLLGTTYGGNGQTTFALPDLRGRIPIHMGNGHTLGEKAGEEAHTLTSSEMPAHFHFFQVSQSNADTPIPTNNTFGSSNNAYAAATNLTSLLPGTVSNVGGSQPHENRQPFLTLNVIICLQGIFPSQN